MSLDDLKFLNYFVVQTSELGNQKRVSTDFLLNFFDAPVPHVTAFTTKTNTKVEPHTTCVNALSNFNNDLCYVFEGVK